MEGVPEAAPRHVNCTSISSQSIKISWQEPYLQYHGGILQGYKILYTPLVEDSKHILLLIILLILEI